MATYDYYCPRCGEIQVEQKLGADALTECPEPCTVFVNGGVMQAPCGEPVQRLISSGTHFTLKGSGWAKDGYK